MAHLVGRPSRGTWYYIFRVSVFRPLPYQLDGNETWALGVNGRWGLVRVIGIGFLDNIEVDSNDVSIVGNLVTLVGRWQS